MTNKEKFIKVFNQEPDDTICPVYCSSNGKECPFYKGFHTYGSCEAGDWWNAEYKEPTTKNDLVTIHTEGLDIGIRCAMCTNSMKSDRGCDGSCVVDKDMYKKVMDVIESNIVVEPTTKNDLGVDCISREQAKVAIRDKFKDLPSRVEINTILNELPSVTPQLSSELEKNSQKLEKDFGELDCISRADAIRVASGYCHPSNVAKELAKLPSMGRYDPYTDKFIKE